MSSMFSGCSSLKELNLSNFNINNVTYMDGMFYRCSDDLKKNIIGKIKGIKDEQQENIHFILVTLLVLKLLRFNSFNDEQEENISLILVTLLILKLLRFNSFNDKQKENI